MKTNNISIVIIVLIIIALLFPIGKTKCNEFSKNEKEMLIKMTYAKFKFAINHGMPGYAEEFYKEWDDYNTIKELIAIVRSCDGQNKSICFDVQDFRITWIDDTHGMTSCTFIWNLKRVGSNTPIMVRDHMAFSLDENKVIIIHSEKLHETMNTIIQSYSREE